jgi:hypothetical protein
MDERLSTLLSCRELTPIFQFAVSMMVNMENHTEDAI